MASDTIKHELQEQLELLGPDEQQQVLDFAQTLAAKGAAGTAGQELTRFAGTISPSDLDIILAEIDAGCEQIYPDEQ